MSAKHLNSESFKKIVLEEGTTALVDFWAEWCGPCRMLAPTVDEVAEELGEEYLIAKVNVDNEREIAMEYGVMSIPTVIFFKNGKEVSRLVGVQSKTKLIETLKSI